MWQCSCGIEYQANDEILEIIKKYGMPQEQKNNYFIPSCNDRVDMAVTVHANDNGYGY